jgi:oligopeptide transport system substrate-binding protein
MRPFANAPRPIRGAFRFIQSFPRTASFILVAAFLMAGCKPPERRADLVIVNGGEPESLDPAIVTSYSDMRVTKALFEGLLRLDGTNARPIAALADRWNVSDDKTVYTFHIRSNVTWSTGEPITAEDVFFSWKRALDPATAADYAGQLFYIKNAEPYYAGTIKDFAAVGLQAVDPWTFRVELEAPTPFFLDLCCFPTLAVVPRQVMDKLGDQWLSAKPLPVSGPYELVYWKLNDRIRLKKNERYWDAPNTSSTIVDVLPTTSPNVALNLYETGIADIVWDKDLIPTELLDVLKKRPDFHTFDYLGTYFFRFNVTRKPFDDPRVRRGFALATDKQRLTRKLTQGGEKPAAHFVPDGTANYEAPEGLPYDPAAGRKLLAEAGFPEGRGFPVVQYTFFSSAGGAAKMQGKVAIELQQMWKENLGVTIELRQIERKIFYSAQSRLDFDMTASSWVGDYNDPNTFLDLYMSNSGNNRTGWKSTRYDNLIRQANRQLDPRARVTMLQQAEHLLVAEEVPVVPLFFYVGFNYFDPNTVTGMHQNVLDEHPFQELGKRSQAPH